MAVIETRPIRIMSLLNAQGAISNMVSGNGPEVIPCATANGGEICMYASPTGCTSRRDEGLVYTSSGVECPKQLGALTIIETNGSTSVNPK